MIECLCFQLTKGKVPESEPEDGATPCVDGEFLVSCLVGHGCGGAGKEGELGKGVSNRD